MLLEMLKLRMGGSAATFFVGAIVPGFLVLTEVMLFLTPCNSNCTIDKLVAKATSGFDGFDGLGPSVLLLMFVSFASFAFGLLAQQVSSGLWSMKPHKRRIALQELVAALQRAYGHDAVQDVFGQHPIFASIGAHRSPTPEGKRGFFRRAWQRVTRRGRESDPEGTVPPDDFDSARGHVFAYTKAWLNSRAPRLSVDADEVRINVLYGAFLPIVLIPSIPAKIAWERGWSLPDAAPLFFAWLLLAGLLASVHVRAGRALQSVEHARAMRNFLFAHWFGAEPTDVARERADNAPSSSGSN